MGKEKRRRMTTRCCRPSQARCTVMMTHYTVHCREHAYSTHSHTHTVHTKNMHTCMIPAYMHACILEYMHAYMHTCRHAGRARERARGGESARDRENVCARVRERESRGIRERARVRERDTRIPASTKACVHTFIRQQLYRTTLAWRRTTRRRVNGR